MSVITDFVTNFIQNFAPDVQVTATATPSATTAAAGQFSTVSSDPVSAPIVARSTTTTTVTVKLRKSRGPNSAVDPTSPLTILISGASGTIDSVTASVGTVINATGLGTQRAIITIMPAATGIVTAAIVSSGNIVTTTMLRHRTFATVAAVV